MDEPVTALRTSDFDYLLPPDLIAQTPSARREDSRLLVVMAQGREGAMAQGGAEFTDKNFSDLPDLIPPGDLMVINTTRVRRARFIGRRASGAPAEVLLLHPAADATWIAMGKPGSALRAGKRVTLDAGTAIEVIEELDEGYRRVRFLGDTAEGAMARLGRIPLPPYIEREPTAEDAERYQTVFAEREGSVAAPTAGLHFTPAVFDAIAARGIGVARIDLEVGPGTFKPVDHEEIGRHPMHPEAYTISTEAAEAIAGARARGARVWAVGTTVVRALESAARDDGTVAAGSAVTRLLIAPGYRFRVVDGLLTNFHLPRSTLLMLVAAFAGYEATMAAYRAAVARRYRFYSYGDAMVIFRHPAAGNRQQA